MRGRWRRWRARRPDKSGAHDARVLGVRVRRRHAPPAERALIQPRLAACARHVVHPDRAAALPEACAAWSIDGRRVSKLTAHDVRVVDAPVVVHHCAPFATAVDLDAPLASA